MSLDKYSFEQRLTTLEAKVLSIDTHVERLNKKLNASLTEIISPMEEICNSTASKLEEFRVRLDGQDANIQGVKGTYESDSQVNQDMMLDAIDQIEGIKQQLEQRFFAYFHLLNSISLIIITFCHPAGIISLIKIMQHNYEDTDS